MLSRKLNLLAAIFIFLLTGCTLEQKLAREFVKMESPIRIFLLQPDYIFKNNLKDFEIPGIDTLGPSIHDSLLLSNSLFLKDVSDSAVIYEFITGFSKAVESYGMEIIPENAVDTLMNAGGTPFIVNLAQFSLEEYIHPYSSEELVYDEIVVIDGIDLNAINFNLWVELGRMNTEGSNRVLFASAYLLDNLNGTLRQHLVSGEMSFDYSIDTITLAGIYEFARSFGKTSAGYLYDYLMNVYISENLPENYPYEKYDYHYDPVRRLIMIADEGEKFIELERK
jgi:hypothetical protein